MPNSSASRQTYFVLDDGHLFRQEGGVHYLYRAGRWTESMDPGMLGFVELKTDSFEQALQVALKKSLEKFKTFVVDSAPPGFNSRNLNYSEGDERAKLMSESFLYPLLGKEDARSVLARWHRIESIVQLMNFVVAGKKGGE